jgi:hypothetical protein
MEGNKIKTPGIVVLGVLAIVWGILMWLTGLTNSDGRLATPGELRPWTNNFLVSDNFFVNCKFYAITSLPFIAGIGVLMKRNWGRILYIMCAIIGIFWVLFNTVRDVNHLTEARNQIFLYVGFLLCYVIIYFFPIWYFNRAKIKEQFKSLLS